MNSGLFLNIFFKSYLVRSERENEVWQNEMTWTNNPYQLLFEDSKLKWPHLSPRGPGDAVLLS